MTEVATDREAWSRVLSRTRESATRTIARAGGVIALATIAAFWSWIYFDEKLDGRGLLRWGSGLLYLLYVFVCPLLSVATLIVSINEAASKRRGWPSAVGQLILAICALFLWYWTFVNGKVEVP